MKYTIIDTKKKALFIQQHYDTAEEANTRLDKLKAKFNGLYPIAVVGVDEKGSFHKVVEEGKEKKTS